MLRNLPLLLALIFASFVISSCSTSNPPEWGNAGNFIGRSNVPLIPREVLFSPADISGIRLSPDGSRVLYHKAEVDSADPVDRVSNIYVGEIGNLAGGRRLTNFSDRGVRGAWAWNGRHIVYSRDTDGNEATNVYAIDADTGTTRAITNYTDPRIRAGVAGASRNHPNELIISANDVAPHFYPHLYRVNLVTGEKTLHLRNTENWVAVEMDDDFNVHFVALFSPAAEVHVLRRKQDGTTAHFTTIPAEDIYTTTIIGFSKDRKYAYALDSRNRNTGALTQVDLESGEVRELFSHELADVADVALDPDSRLPQYAVVDYLKPRYKVFNRDLYEELAALERLEPGTVQIVSATQDNRKWLVVFTTDTGSVPYYLWDRDTRTATFVHRMAPDFDELPLSPMLPIVITARDGLEMVSYLTLPLEVMRTPYSHQTTRRVPLVLNVHGGPTARDSWGLNVEHQFLANRGYAVLSVNYRSSTGFGKAHINAGNMEWGRKMHTDLLDAVQWAIDQGIADPDRVAIYGASYGGYATLWGMTNTPDVFACGISNVGPSNLETLIRNAPSAWKPTMAIWHARIGNPDTPEGRAVLRERSPLTYASNISKPLMVAQGGMDPRVTKAESEQIVAAARANSIPVTYALFPREGHGFGRRENINAFYAMVEAFLAQHLGGRSEPFGSAISEADLELPEGAGLVPGLAEAAGLVEVAPPPVDPTPAPQPVEPAPAPQPVPQPVEPTEAKPEEPAPKPELKPIGNRNWRHGRAGDGRG